MTSRRNFWMNVTYYLTWKLESSVGTNFFKLSDFYLFNVLWPQLFITHSFLITETSFFAGPVEDACFLLSFHLLLVSFFLSFKYHFHHVNASLTDILWDLVSLWFHCTSLENINPRCILVFLDSSLTSKHSSEVWQILKSLSPN